MFTAESSPGRLVAVSLDALSVEGGVDVDGTFAAAGIAQDSAGRYFVKTATKLTQVSICFIFRSRPAARPRASDWGVQPGGASAG